MKNEKMITTAKDLRRELIKVLKRNGLEALSDKLKITYTNKQKTCVDVTFECKYHGKEFKFEDGSSIYRSKYFNSGFEDIVRHFDRRIADRLMKPAREIHLPFDDIVDHYINDTPADKCLVIDMTTDPKRPYMGFIKFSGYYPGRFNAYFVYIDGYDSGTGVQREYNMPSLSCSMMYYGYEPVTIKTERSGKEIYERVCIPALIPLYESDDGVTEKNPYGVWREDKDECFFFIGSEYSSLSHHNHGWKIKDVRIVDCPDEGTFVDSFAEEYIKERYSHLFKDIPDDPELDEEYEACKSYDPDAFEYWKDYFCRKRCMIDSGAGCGSNCCKARLISFINWQYNDYKIPSVDGQPNRFTEDEIEE